MSLKEIKDRIRQLPESHRLELLNDIIESLQAPSRSNPDRTLAISQMKGLLKTDRPAPTDVEVAAMLEEHRLEKYR
jgi:hypothetical protein